MDAVAWLQCLENTSDEEAANSLDKCKHSQINKPTTEWQKQGQWFCHIELAICTVKLQKKIISKDY